MGGKEIYLQLFLNPGTIWGGSNQLHTLAASSPEKEFVVPIE